MLSEEQIYDSKFARWVEQVLFDPLRRVAAGRGKTILVYDRTGDGTVRLLVVVTDEAGGVAFVGTARDMTRREGRTFDRKAR